MPSAKPSKTQSSSRRSSGGHRKGRRSRGSRRRRRRMLLIVAACAVIGGVLLAGVGFFVVRKVLRNPQRYERLSHELLNEGRLDDAVQQFRRGLAYARNERQRVAMLTSMADRIEATVVPVEEAAERWFAAAGLRVTAARQTPEAAGELPVEKWYWYARLSHHPRMWQLCHRGIRARVHQGVARPGDEFREAVCRIELSLLGGGKPPNGWQAAREALGDPRGTRRKEVLAMQALCDAALANEVEQSNPQQGRMLRRQAVATAHDLLQAPENDGLLTRTVALRTLQTLHGPKTWQLLSSDPGVDYIFQLLEQPPPLNERSRRLEEAAVIRYLLRCFTPPPGVERNQETEERMSQLRERAQSLVEAEPESALVRAALAESATAQGQLEEADSHFARMLERETLEAHVESVFLALLRRQALTERVIAAMDQLDGEKPEHRQKNLTLLRARVKEAKAGLNEKAPARRLLGHWLAFYEGRPVQCLARILQDRMTLSPQLMNRNQLVLARALTAVDEWGGAAELLHRIHRTNGRGLTTGAYWSAEQLRAEALLQLRRPEEALEALNRLSEQFSDESPATEHWLAAARARVRAADSTEKLADAASGIKEKIQQLPAEDRTEAVLLLCEVRDRMGHREQGHADLEQFRMRTPGTGRVGATLLRRLTQDGETERAKRLAEDLLAVLPDGAIKAELSERQDDASWNPEHLALLASALGEPQQKTAVWLRYLAERKRWSDFGTALDTALNGRDEAEAPGLLFLEAVSRSEQAKALTILADQLERREHWHWLATLARARQNLLSEQPQRAFELVESLTAKWGFLSAVAKTRGAAAMALNRYDDARESLRVVTHSNPGDVAAHLALARCDHQLSRHADALNSLGKAWRWSRDAGVRERFLNYAARYGDARRVIAVRKQIANLEPENLQNRVLLADLLYTNENENEARTLANELRREGVESLRLAHLLARMHLGADEREHAITLLRDACRKHLAENKKNAGPLFSVLSLLRRMGEAEFSNSLIESRLQSLSGDEREPWVRARALLLYREGDFAGTLDVLQAENPEVQSPGTVALQVRCLTKMNRLEEAERKLTSIPSEVEDPEIELAEAELAAAKHQWGRARRICGILLNRNPERLQARIIRMQAALAGNLKDAEEVLSQDMKAVARLRPDHPVLYRILTIQALEKGNVQGAAEAANRLLEQDAADPKLLAAVGEAWRRQSQFDELKNALDSWLDRFPDSPELLILQAAAHAHAEDAVERMNTLKRAYEQAPTPEIARHYALALLENSRWDRAHALFENAPFTVKNNARLLLLRSWSRARAGEPKKAAGDALNAMLHRADQPDALKAMVAEASNFLGNDTLQRALAKQMEIGDPKKACAFALHHIRLKTPDFPAVAEAEAFADKLPEGHPLHQATLSMIADGWLRIKHSEKALPIYKALLENDTSSAHTLNNAAYAAAQLETDLPKAVKWAQSAVDAVADSPLRRANYLDTLGQAQWKNGQTQDAEQSFLRSIRYSKNAEVRLSLARLLADQGQFEEAEKHLSLAEKMARNSENTELLQAAASLRTAHLPLSR